MRCGSWTIKPWLAQPTKSEACAPPANPIPVLAGTKLIAEAWDAARLSQVGTFSGDSWEERNGRFRDDNRCFMKADRSTVRCWRSAC